MTTAPRFYQMPAEGPITGGFGEWYYIPGVPPYQHRGIDIGCPKGTPVFAPATGYVVPMTNDGSFGNAVCIDHGPEYEFRYTMYAHLDRKLVVLGDWLERGTKIGYSGGSGKSGPDTYAPHLHWQLCMLTTFPVYIGYSRDPLLTLEPEAEMDPRNRELFQLINDPPTLGVLEQMYNTFYDAGWIRGDRAVPLAYDGSVSDLNSVLVMTKQCEGVAWGPNWVAAYEATR